MKLCIHGHPMSECETCQDEIALEMSRANVWPDGDIPFAEDDAKYIDPIDWEEEQRAYDAWLCEAHARSDLETRLVFLNGEEPYDPFALPF